MKNRSMLAIASLLLIALGSSSCVQKMGTEGHLRPFNAARSQPPEHTIAWGALPQAPAPPKVITASLLERGRQRFEIYCTPCHGYTGYGDGMIVQRGFLAPPSFHTDRLRKVADQHIYDVISQGLGAMYSYGDRVEPADRWAIIAYIRALQLSQNISANQLNDEDLARLSSGSTHD